jgi:sporulation protein YlmC with PRC-barrel domain
MKHVLATSSVLAISLAVPVMAQNSDSQSDQNPNQQSADTSNGSQDGSNVDVLHSRVMALHDWNYEDLYQEGSWSAEQLFDAEVYGSEGEEIGDVENIVIGTNGSVQSLILEVGGCWDIGDTHVSVPWSEADVQFQDDEPRVQVPLTEDNVDDYDVFGGTGGEFRVVDDDNPDIQRGWRATELIHDYVTLQDGERYGWVDDILFDQGGKVQAVVVDAAYGVSGPYAYPYYGYGYGFRPGYNYYQLPYGDADVEALEPFDLDRLQPDSGEG